MAKVYGAGAVMGFTPQQVNEMSMWQFNAALEGYVEANSADESAGKLSQSEADEIWEWMQEMG
ncbi:hypothetical protein [Martelella mangrovi]|uniref:Uncharacterized protein n=1 Tax=Martelella mangrovi TaxID=1397477 RepID=A0ABV2IFV9_9HYPH